MLREIRARGYAGGISQLKSYLAPLKQREAEPVVRFETPIGKQMQADFTTLRRGRAPLKAFVATLGYSRASFVRFSAREDSEAWLCGLREAFAYFGGVPEEVAAGRPPPTPVTPTFSKSSSTRKWRHAIPAVVPPRSSSPPSLR